MALYWFLLVVTALAVGSVPAQASDRGQALVASFMLVAGWCLLIQTVGRTTRRASVDRVDRVEPLEAARLLERQLDILRWMGLLVAAVCFLAFRLAATIQTWPFVGPSMALRALVLLCPGIAITASAWLCEHRYGVAMGYAERKGIAAVAKDLAQSLVASGAWIVFPVLLILIGTDLFRWSGWFDERSSAMVTSFLAIVCIPLVLPFVICRVWHTIPIVDTKHAWIMSLLKHVGTKRLPVRHWDTGMSSYNAVVAGFLPGLRSLIVTDRLLDELPRRELTMVLLHEIAHVRRWHVWLRVLAMGPSWIVGVGVSSLLPESPMNGVVTSLIALAVTLVTLRAVAHATEYDADRLACEMAMRLPAEFSPPHDAQEAVDLFAKALKWVTRYEQKPDRPSWLHPSVNARCQRLEAWGHRQVSSIHSTIREEAFPSP
jgi:Zn-dependent protease with chaperone function